MANNIQELIENFRSPHAIVDRYVNETGDIFGFDKGPIRTFAFIGDSIMFGAYRQKRHCKERAYKKYLKKHGFSDQDYITLYEEGKLP